MQINILNLIIFEKISKITTTATDTKNTFLGPPQGSVLGPIHFLLYVDESKNIFSYILGHPGSF